MTVWQLGARIDSSFAHARSTTRRGHWLASERKDVSTEQRQPNQGHVRDHRISQLFARTCCCVSLSPSWGKQWPNSPFSAPQRALRSKP